MLFDPHACTWRLYLVVASAVSFAATAHGVPLSGTVTYAGSNGPVSAAHPMQVALFDQPIAPQSKAVGQVAVETSPGSFNADVAAGTYYLAVFLDVIADGKANIGEPFQIYSEEFSPPGDPLNVSGAGVTGLSITFDDTALLSGVAGTVTYSGSLGSVSSTRRLIVEQFSDAMLTEPAFDQVSVKANGGRFDLITFDNSMSYLKAYLDLNNSREEDAGEPFAIYNQKSSPPADPVTASDTQTAIAISFGDENIGTSATPKPSLTSSCVGDCNDDQKVTVNEILVMVNVALGSAVLSNCQAGDANTDGKITVSDILVAVNNALGTCAGAPTPTPTGGPTTHTVVVGPNGLLVFDPSDLTIHVGDTVEWTWSSGGHNVVSGGSDCVADNQFCSPSDSNCAQTPLSPAGTMYSHTFTAMGTFPYFCAAHCDFQMVGTITVQ